MYKVKDIIEPDFGCEGLPDGEEICCEVVLEDAGGVQRTVRAADADLYRECIEVGSAVDYDGDHLIKIE